MAPSATKSGKETIDSQRGEWAHAVLPARQMSLKILVVAFMFKNAKLGVILEGKTAPLFALGGGYFKRPNPCRNRGTCPPSALAGVDPEYARFSVRKRFSRAMSGSEGGGVQYHCNGRRLG